MKKYLCIFIICIFSFITLIPGIGVFAYTQDEKTLYDGIGSYYLTSMILSGDANELDFSTGNQDIDFLTALGESLFTGDYSNLIEWGFENILDTITDTAIEIDNTMYELNPEFYTFLVGYNDGATTRIQYKPYAGHQLRRLFQNLQPSGNNTPNPDTNYLPYINCINGSTPWGNLVPHSFFENGVVGSGNLQHQINNVTLYSHPSSYSNFTKSHIADYDISACAVGSNVATIYIHSSENGYWITDFEKPLDNTSFYYQWNSPSYTAFGTFNSNGIGMATNGMGATTYTWKTVNFQSYYQSLDDLFTFLVQTVRHVNIYVDGVPWSLVESNSLPIEIPGQLTILNNYPAQYYYPEPVYFDMNDLVSRIRTAINTSDVIKYSDIEDLIVDVNGQQAIAVVNFARTDYDLLASEQIPYYPKFYYDNNLNQYVQTGANIINISTEVLPRDVLNILITCGIILLFGYVVRRLLE